MHKLRKIQRPPSTLIASFLVVVNAFEFQLEKSLSNPILTAIVPANDGAGGISEERIDEILGQVDGVGRI